MTGASRDLSGPAVIVVDDHWTYVATEAWIHGGMVHAYCSRVIPLGMRSELGDHCLRSWPTRRCSSIVWGQP